MQKYIEKMTGFKATDEKMTCKGHTFELGKWYEMDGEIELCKRGFHFCVHPSGPWAYYKNPGTRIFKVEAEQVLDVPVEPGADFKLVCRRIRLTEEVKFDGDRNTGNRNTGNRNTGNRNTGNRNTGDRNTGDRNTGDSNTGDRNTGHWNTGHWNTGDRNTGNRNTGDRNTGDRNTGNRNTGDSNTGHSNTGHRNTGHWNTANRSCGVFCLKEPKVISFDVQTKLTMEQFLVKYPEANSLGELLASKEPIAFAQFKRIPGITKAKLQALHKAYLAGRKQQ